MTSKQTKEPDDRGGSQLAVSFPSARSERDISRLAQDVFALPGRIAEARHRLLPAVLAQRPPGVVEAGEHLRPFAAGVPRRSAR